MKRFLFFDIDGTLVSFKSHKIPESAIYGLTLAKEKGAGIYIDTGRPYGLINNIEEIKTWSMAISRLTAHIVFPANKRFPVVRFRWIRLPL